MRILQAWPIYHHQRNSIEAHLTIVFTALAVSRWIEARTGWSIRKFIRNARRYCTVEIQAGAHTITAADRYPAISATPSTASTDTQLRTSALQVGFMRGFTSCSGVRARFRTFHQTRHQKRRRRSLAVCARHAYPTISMPEA
jgi:hypothetical protein